MGGAQKLGSRARGVGNQGAGHVRDWKKGQLGGVRLPLRNRTWRTLKAAGRWGTGWLRAVVGAVGWPGSKMRGGRQGPAHYEQQNWKGQGSGHTGRARGGGLRGGCVLPERRCSRPYHAATEHVKSTGLPGARKRRTPGGPRGQQQGARGSTGGAAHATVCAGLADCPVGATRKNGQ